MSTSTMNAVNGKHEKNSWAFLLQSLLLLFCATVYFLNAMCDLSGWCQRIKSEFKFEYLYLEDELSTGAGDS